jgi:uncharacterized damage-inducible protein DinB
MTQISEPLMNEFRAETATTKRVLNRIPADKLSWKPHPKSMSLGQLALHIAKVPGGLATILQKDEEDLSPSNFTFQDPKDLAEIQTALDESTRVGEKFIEGLDEQKASATWRLKSNGRTVLETPRIGVVRSIMLNHWYHHRGQLSVYLRMLDVPVPSIYGPSADENPFG